jgi:hypothetical protein
MKNLQVCAERGTTCALAGTMGKWKIVTILDPEVGRI